jgi:hypothetical protein
MEYLPTQFIFIYGSFNAISISYYTGSKDRVADEY